MDRLCEKLRGGVIMDDENVLVHDRTPFVNTGSC